MSVRRLDDDATGWDALRAHWGRHRERVTDGASVAFVLFSGLVVVVSAADGGAVWWWRSAVTVAVAAAMWWRRRYPVAVTAAACLGVLVGAPETALTLALFTLAIRRRDRVLTAMSLAGGVAFVIAWSVRLQGTDPVALAVSAVFSAAFFVGLPVAFGAYVGARRDLLTSLRERAERAEAEQHLRAEQSRLAERARIAQEMHDVLAHRISLVSLHAGGLEVNPAVGPEKVERAAALIRTTAHQALEDLRQVLGVLRAGEGEDGGDLAPQPTLDDVPRLVEASRSAGVRVALTDDRYETADVRAVVGRTAFRAVQEGLTNVHKHARGATATVLLAGAPGADLLVEVRNARPVGSDDTAPVPGAGMGLVGLAERVELAGGTMTAGPTPDGGFAVRASLPWPAAEEGDG